MSWAIWITGLPGSGKTTIAQKLHDTLGDIDIDVDVKVLELDEIRRFITPVPSYTGGRAGDCICFSGLYGEVARD